MLLIQNLFSFFRPTSDSNKQWMIKSDNNLHLVILGSNGLAEEFSTKLKVTIIILYLIQQFYNSINP